MSDIKENSNQYTITDIQQYLQGKLSSQEMHAMEKAALDDPFLADAIEGMQQAMQEHDEQTIQAQLQEARQQIANKTTTKTKSVVLAPIRWWRVAAAASVLIIATVWVYTYLTPADEKERPVAQTHVETITDSNNATATSEKEKIADKTVAADTTTAYLNNTDTGKALKARLSYSTNEVSTTLTPVLPLPSIKFKSRKKEQTNANKTAAEQADSLLLAATPTHDRNDEVKPPPVAKATEPQREQIEEVVVQSDSYKKGSKDSLLTKTLTGKVAGIGFDDKTANFISGRVINQNNVPLANASLYVENNQYNFYTDKAGLFKIPAVTDSVVDISVNVVGYNTQRFRLQNNAVAYNQLQLMPQAANNLVLHDVAVEEKANANRKKADTLRQQLARVMIQQAQPVYGWVQYEQYLQTNKRVPVNNPNLKGEVVVSFEISKKGTLSNYKIEQSLAKEYDAEAIRLVKEGPRWKSLNGRRSGMTIVVRF